MCEPLEERLLPYYLNIYRTSKKLKKDRKLKLLPFFVFQNFVFNLKARTHRDEYRRALFASVFQRVFCVHTQAIFADDVQSEHANSFPDIRWRLM